jgi:hypothetical protein
MSQSDALILAALYSPECATLVRMGYNVKIWGAGPHFGAQATQDYEYHHEWAESPEEAVRSLYHELAVPFSL